jgi:hypothetical protein
VCKLDGGELYPYKPVPPKPGETDMKNGYAYKLDDSELNPYLIKMIPQKESEKKKNSGVKKAKKPKKNK